MSLIDELLRPGEPERKPPKFNSAFINDRWNCARLLHEVGADMLYVGGKGWGIWDGARFDFSDGKHRALAIADKLEAILRADSEAAWKEDWPEMDVARFFKKEKEKKSPRCSSMAEALEIMRMDQALAIKRHSERCGNLDVMKRVLEIAEPRRRVPVRKLDADPWSFTVPNGRIDLRRAAASEIQWDDPTEAARIRAGWIAPHDRAACPTKCAGVAFDPVADCPEWRDFLRMILPDLQVRDCFQRCMGAMLFGRNEPQVAYLFRGSGGNGKSTAVNALAAVFGSESGYAVPCKIEMFLVMHSQNASQATPEEVDIPGARVLIASEPEADDELSAKRIKSMTGGDLRPARALNMPQFFYRPTAFPILSFNRTPKIKGEDEGMRRRLVFIPFDVNLRGLPASKQRSPVEMAAIFEAEGSGILNWLLDGWREYRARADAGIGAPPGIDPPPVMLELKEALLESSDPVGEFLADCCQSLQYGRIRVSELFTVYGKWCEASGVGSLGKQTFNRMLIEKGQRRQKTNGGVSYWTDLAWQVSGNMHSLLTLAGFPPSYPPPD